MTPKTHIAPHSHELFDRLAQVTNEMTATCSQVEHVLSDLDTSALSNDDSGVLQNLDRMTQNLGEISKLLKRLSLTEDQLERRDISEAIETIILPSLKRFLANGEEQDQQGSVDLF